MRFSLTALLITFSIISASKIPQTQDIDVFSAIGAHFDTFHKILTYLNYQDVARLKRTSAKLNKFLSLIKVNWLSMRYLNEEEKWQLIEAVRHNDRNKVKQILSNTPVYLDFEYGRDLRTKNLLKDAICYGSIEIVEMLIRHGFTLETYNFTYILDTCMRCCKFEQMKMLLSEHPDLTRAMDLGRILIDACDNGVRSLEVEEMRWLFDNYPLFRTFINQKRYRYPIHVARCLDVLKLLLEYGADPNARTISRLMTKLHLVMEESVMERPLKIKCLMDAGADVNAEDSNGQRPIDILRANSPDAESLFILTGSTEIFGHHNNDLLHR